MDKQLILYSPNPFLKYIENYEEKTLLDTRFLNVEKISNVSEGEFIICARAFNVLRICGHPYDFIPIYGVPIYEDTEINSSISSTTVTTTSYD